MKNMNIAMNTPQILLKRKETQVFIKIIICLILITFVYYFYVSSSFQTSLLIAVDDKPKLPQPVTKMHEGSPECDIFSGEWVRDPRGPLYNNFSCSNMDFYLNCMTNGRPDTDYIYWRWSPFGCNLPTFDPKMFLRHMRNKAMAFIGDSISKNHLQSLLCILSQVEEAIEVYHDETKKNRRWYFEPYNFTLSVIWSPFLLKAYEDGDRNSLHAIELHLDELDLGWVNQFTNYNYIVISSGPWFLKAAVYYENNTRIGCFNCNIENVTEIFFSYAYKKALRTALDFITKSNHKAYTFYRITTLDHFENGHWNTGGYCNRTRPFKNEELNMGYINKMFRDIELEEFENAKRVMNGSGLRLIDTVHMSLRPDGHPGRYGKVSLVGVEDTGAYVHLQHDCLHWCLPGPIDSWNDLLMSLLLNSRGT